jgi:pyridoxal phosphate enzyme (YggS family)
LKLSNITAKIAANLARIRERIAYAARRSGRLVSDVQLVAATKYVNVDLTRAVFNAGCRDLGESRPQDLWAKAAALADTDAQWHLIGHLQRNKIRRTLPWAKLIHSIDSTSTLVSVDRVASEMQLVAEVLLEVNTSGEAAKGGVSPDAVVELLDRAATLSHVRVNGLMTMAALEGGIDVARRNFASLRELRNALRPQYGDHISLFELSMGMSGDYDVAIEEGATIVRIGSALFEGISTDDVAL